jgi:hypothetical protein
MKRAGYSCIRLAARIGLACMALAFIGVAIAAKEITKCRQCQWDLYRSMERAHLEPVFKLSGFNDLADYFWSYAKELDAQDGQYCAFMHHDRYMRFPRYCDDLTATGQR